LEWDACVPDLTGKSLGRFYILKPLGEGGMAFVYKAYDTREEQEVAIKVILPGFKHSEEFEKAFQRETRTMKKLAHPNIVKVLEHGEHEGLHYLVLEYVPGGTLKQFVGTPMSWVDAARLVEQAARALEYAHTQKIIHLDIKPSNILVSESKKVSLTDFGIAHLLQEGGITDLTGTSVGIGTPEYMAPEQRHAKKVDHRVDIYALGVVFYELVTGKQPFRADTPMAVAIKHTSDPLPPPRKVVPDLPEAVEQVIFKALAKDPADRYEDMGAFAAALQKLGYQSEHILETARHAVSGLKPAVPEEEEDEIFSTTESLFTQTISEGDAGSKSGDRTATCLWIVLAVLAAMVFLGAVVLLVYAFTVLFPRGQEEIGPVAWSCWWCLLI
jgi:serine/threonine protein kinase